VLLVIAALGLSGCARDLDAPSAHAESGGCKGAALLPDLVAEVPNELRIVHVGVSSQFLLIFRTAVHNAGRGPLWIVGQRSSRAETTLAVRQLVVCADGGNEILYGAGVMGYENGPTHRHWHYLAFERYTLTGLSVRTPPTRSRKAGFCLVDDYDSGLPLAGKPHAAIFTEPGNACAAEQPGALSAQEGLSVGWADQYQPYKEGQYVDLTHLPAGEYRLTNEIDVQRLLLESRYDDGVAGVTIRLSWPNGPSSFPAATVLGTCSGQATCGAGASRAGYSHES
jgi:hypothetical protein